MKHILFSIFIVLALNSFSQIVNIPDANFKAYLVGNTLINTNSDTEIQLSEATAFTGTIDCSSLNITNLIGIETFTSLTELGCSSNQLTSLNVTQNIALTNLACGQNQLISLDVSQNILLSTLTCEQNSLISLDISQNPYLTFFDCNNNQLECLNASSGLNSLVLFFRAFGNPNLTCIEVFDVAWSTANWTDINNWMYFSLDCTNSTCFCTTTFSSINETGLDFYTSPSGIVYTDNGIYKDVIPNAAGCDSIITITLSMNYTGIDELINSSKDLLKIVDIMGKETSYKSNTALIYIYSDGTTERVFKLED
tara:strand:- start:117 stop:1046 length:930 start_codon:yes stop_codon:yes gene_type:complete